MITKNYKSIFSFLAALTTALFVVSCDQEDNTGFGTLVPTAPTLSVTTSVSSKSLIEDDSVYEFTATLSTPQLVDVKLFISQVEGDATNGDDYTVDGSLVIAAGATSAKGKITILSDELIEATETVKLQIGDNLTANASLTPATMEFTILNYTDGDLVIDLSWAMASATTDNTGEVIDPTDFADMRLLLSSTPDNLNAGDNVADGGSFETFVLSADSPDGEYYIVTDFYDANADIVRDLDLNLEFNQAGVINGDSFEFPAALNNLGICELNFYVMTKVTKAGNTYTFEDIRTQSYELSSYDSYTGIDADFDSQVATKSICDGIFIKGLNAGWMLNYWGEIVIDEKDVFASIDADGKITIAEQFLYTTTWNGDVQPDYSVSGSGTYDSVTGEINIKYSLWQDGDNVIIDFGLFPDDWPTEYFEANLTLAP